MSRIFRYVVLPLLVAFSITPAVKAENSLLKFFTNTTSSEPETAAAAAAAQKVAFQPQAAADDNIAQDITDANAIIFSAPPRETPEVGRERYGPVAEYLSKVLGKKVVYKHPGTWGVYRTEMLKGNYDIVFDGPHFNSYRMENLDHNILAKMEIKHQFVVIMRKDDKRFNKLNELAGRTFCTHAPPNLGTLTLLSQFENPARQPVIRNTKGWKNIYDGVVAGKCVAGILPIANLNKYDPSRASSRTIYTHRALPNQAFSAGPRLTREEQIKISRALVAPEAKEPTAKLRAAYRVGNSFITASNEEYLGVSEYLKNEWGYY